MGLLSQTTCFLPNNREAPHSWSIYQIPRWHPWRQDHNFGYLVLCPGLLEYVGDHASSPCMGWWGLVTSLISQHYSHQYTIVPSVLRGKWVVSIMFRRYKPLWWWSTSSPKSKRCLGGSVCVWKHLFHQSNLFYWVSIPHHPLPHLAMMERGECLSVSLYPLCLWSYISPWYGRSITYVLFTCTKFTGSPEFTICL